MPPRKSGRHKTTCLTQDSLQVCHVEESGETPPRKAGRHKTTSCLPRDSLQVSHVEESGETPARRSVTTSLASPRSSTTAPSKSKFHSAPSKDSTGGRGNDPNASPRKSYSVSAADKEKTEANKKRFSVGGIFGTNRKEKKRQSLVPTPMHHEEEKHEDPGLKLNHAAVVRAVYSSARKSLARAHTQELAASDTTAAAAGEEPKKPRITLKLAAQAVRHATKQTLLGRNLVAAFKQNVEDHEQEKDETEEERLARESEEEEKKWKRRGMKRVHFFNTQAQFLTDILDDLQKFRTTGDAVDKCGPLVDEMMANMSTLMMKMNALKSMYNMDRRSCQALNNAIDLCVTDVQNRFETIGETMRVLSWHVQSLNEDMAEQMRLVGTAESKLQTLANIEDDDIMPEAPTTLERNITEAAGMVLCECTWDAHLQKSFLDRLMESIQQEMAWLNIKVDPDDELGEQGITVKDKDGAIVENEDGSSLKLKDLDDVAESCFPLRAIFHPPPEKRLDPHDGEMHIFEDIQERLQLEGWTPEDILTYWMEQCEVKEEREPEQQHGKSTGLWHKAANFMWIGGTMKALNGGMQDVSEATQEAGNKPAALMELEEQAAGLRRRSLEGNKPDEVIQLEEVRPSTVPESAHHRAQRHWKTGLQDFKRAMVLTRSSVTFEGDDISKPSTSDTGVPPSSFSDESLASKPEPVPRRPLRDPLDPEEYPAIGAVPVVLPSTVEKLVFGRQTPELTLEPRLKSPFVLIPLVPVAGPLPRLKEPKQIRRAYKKRDAGRSTVEAVLAERERRGLRPDLEELD